MVEFWICGVRFLSFLFYRGSWNILVCRLGVGERELELDFFCLFGRFKRGILVLVVG